MHHYLSIKRKFIQVISTIFSNGYIKGFMEGNIYRGNLKKLCVPGLNCYSCPGALGACPIGALQGVISSVKYTFSFYIIGILIIFGMLFGRFICGWMCPFGLFQELLYKIKTRKYNLSNNKLTKYLKYLVLSIFVIILPIFIVNSLGYGNSTFCKYICPQGTLQGGIILMILNPSLSSAIGMLYFWKLGILITTIITSIIIFRPFCRLICPLGAIYGLFNRLSVYSMYVNENKCIKCNKCYETCKLNIKIYATPNTNECIRCLECIKTCKTNAITGSFKLDITCKSMKV